MESRGAWLGVLVLFALATWWLQPPSQTSDVNLRLERLLEDVGPHPVGSPAAREVERRIRQQLDELGIDSTVEETTLCETECVTVRNLIAALPGRDPNRWILLATHYDSVWAGPGAGDAMSGVAAALEILATLRDSPLEVGVVVLFDEGEEANLYGAKAFVGHSTWSKRVEGVVNLEARGTGGPAYLFEMTGDTLPLARAYAREARRPAASSLYVAIYRLLPNNTDVAVFDQAGIPSANVAFLGAGRTYHTPFDNLDHLDPRSVQHHVDQGLALLRAMASLTAEPRSTPRSSVLFDVFGLFAVATSITTARVVSVLLVLLALGLARPTWAALASQVGGWTLIATAAGLLDAGSQRLGIQGSDLPIMGQLGFWALACGAPVLARLYDGSVRDRLGAVTAIYAGLLAVLAAFLPEGAYLPGLGLPFLLAAHHPSTRPLALLAGLPFAVLAVGLPEALGPYPLVTVAPAGLALLPLSVLLPKSQRGDFLPVIVGLMSFPAQALLPPPPAALVVDHVTDGSAGWVHVWPARFPRGGPMPELDAPRGPPYDLFRAPAGEAPVAPYRPASVAWSGDRVVVRASGGLALKAVADGTITRVQGAPLGRRRVDWLGDTTEVVLEVTPAVERLRIAVGRPGDPLDLDTTLRWHPIHTGIRTWSVSDVSRTPPR